MNSNKIISRSGVLSLLITLLLGLANMAAADVLDDFEDGDYTNNPSWDLVFFRPGMGLMSVVADPLDPGNLVLKGHGDETGHHVIGTDLEAPVPWEGVRFSMDILVSSGYKYHPIIFLLTDDLSYRAGIGIYYDWGAHDRPRLRALETGSEPFFPLPDSIEHPTEEWYRISGWIEAGTQTLHVELRRVADSSLLYDLSYTLIQDLSTLSDIAHVWIAVEEYGWQYVDNVTLSANNPPVAGSISTSNYGLLGVPVDLLDSVGELYSSTTTDDSGFYRFEDIPYGDYTVEIQVPLGYTPISDPSVPVTIAGQDVEVNFTLEENPNTGNVRQAWFWRLQVKVAIRGWGCAQYSADELLQFLNDIRVHFDPHFPIYSEVEGLEGMKEVLSARFCAPVTDRAKKHFFATLLNVVSGRLHTYQIVSRDNATASQAITYMADLLTDDAPDNDWSVILIALNINCAWFDLPAGIIPLDLPQIAYKSGRGGEFPAEFTLLQNYPNPFNPTTDISFSLPTASRVKLEIYNVMGQKVATLVNGQFEAGEHVTQWDGSEAASGVYFYRLRADDFVDTKKMILMK